MVEQIRKLCEQHGTTLKQLEKQLIFGNGTIARWDTNSPSVEKVLKVADYFNVSILEVLGIEKAHPQNESGLDDGIVKLFNELSAQEILQVCAYAEGLIANRKV